MSNSRDVFPSPEGLRPVLDEIYEGASERDAHPAFPHAPFRALAHAGVLGMALPEDIASPGEKPRRFSFSEEWSTLRAVSKADGSVGRILDGHLNGTERVAALAPEPLRSRELEGIAEGRLLLGVWGADPIPGEGEPARVSETGGGQVVEGTKTFCSGATGVDRALILARPPDGSPPGPPLLVYLALDETVEVDRGWFRGAGMRASESHRVTFHGTPVLAILGEPGELAREPYLNRDAIRTAACWAGMADRAVDAALDTLAARSRGEPDEVVSLAAGRILGAQATIDRWLEHAARTADADPTASLAPFAIHLRESVARCCREILDEAALACGSRPFAVADDLDRSRRDLELFLLQHRLKPALARAGREELRRRAG